jgi:hypothetical protein
MRSAIPLVTVSAVARNYTAEAPPTGALPAAFSRPPWRAVAVLAVCAALTVLAVFDNVIHLDVTDDGGPPGHPASAEEIQAGPGHGIVGMRERITAFGGWLHADPLAEGRGFRVTAQVPIEGAV